MATQNQPKEHRSIGSPFSLKYLLPGLAIGILLGVTVLLAYQNHLPKITNALYTVTLLSFGAIIFTFLVVFSFRTLITRKILGENSVGDFLNDAQAVADSVTDQLTQNVLVNIPSETRDRVRNVLPRLANWFIWGRLRNWWWNWILGIFVSLGGLTGTILLINQNQLLEAQNRKIDDQTGLLKAQNELVNRQMQLEEASRRSALVVLMSNIMDKVDREIESQQVGLTTKQKENKKYKLSKSLIGQIAALSYSFKPYRYMDGDTLIDRPLSPERGQLLITLSLLPFDSETFELIFENALFESADLQNATLTYAYLNHINLNGADLSGADLSRSYFLSANLEGANLEGALLLFSDWTEADLSGANLTGAVLHFLNLTGANLTGANLTNTYALNTNFNSAKLSNANLTEISGFEDVNLKDAMLDGANLEGTELTIKQAVSVKSLWECKNIQDAIMLEIKKQRPQLLIAPPTDNEPYR